MKHFYSIKAKILLAIACIFFAMSFFISAVAYFVIFDGSMLGYDEFRKNIYESAGNAYAALALSKYDSDFNAGLLVSGSKWYAGFAAARGKWIMFVDGDDWIDADMCEQMLGPGEKEDVDLVMCGITREYGHSSQDYKFYLRDYTSGGKVYRGKECKWLQKQLLVYNCNIAVAYSKLIRRRLLEEHHIVHDEVLRQGAEGLEFNIRLFEQIRSALFINRPFYHYLYNENSISSSHSEENHRFVIRCFEKIRQLIETSSNRDKLLPWFDNRLLYVIVTTAISGYFNPDNPAPFSEKKKGYAAYLEQPLVKHALQTDNLRGLSKQRRLVLFLIRHRQFRALDAMGRARKWQKEHL